MGKLNVTPGKWLLYKPTFQNKTLIKVSATDHTGATHSILSMDNYDHTNVGRKHKLTLIAEANAKLIADAGNTYNQCGLLPSELLKQRNELLDALQVLRLHKGGVIDDVLQKLIDTTIQNAENI